MATNTGDGATVAFTGTIANNISKYNVINNDALNDGVVEDGIWFLTLSHHTLTEILLPQQSIILWM